MVFFKQNPDAYRGSVYMYKDVGERIRFMPWDYNEAYGRCCGYPIEGYMQAGQSSGLSGGSAISPEGWRFNICAEPARCLVDPTDGISRYFRRMWEDAAFRSAVSSRYRALRAGPWSDGTLRGWFASNVAEMRDAAVRNNERWKEVMLAGTTRDAEAAWMAEVDTLQNWLFARLRWMDTALEPDAVAEIATPSVSAFDTD